MTEPSETPEIPERGTSGTEELSGTPSKATAMTGGIEAGMASVASQAKPVHEVKEGKRARATHPRWKFWKR